MPPHPNTPVLVGCAQVLQRTDDPTTAREPLDLMESTCRDAAEDARAPQLLARASGIRVPRGLWQYSNPAALLAERFGAGRVESALGGFSGCMVQQMLDDAALAIEAGRHEVVVITGAECEHSRRRARRDGTPLPRTEQLDAQPDRVFDVSLDGFSRKLAARGLRSATHIFALADCGLRARAGESLDAHRLRIATLWSGLSRVAAENPHAWLQRAMTPEELLTPTADNRWIVFPYTKYLVSNIAVDMGAAVILCSLQAAERAGVPEERRVYLHAAVEAGGAPPLAERQDIFLQPALSIGAQRLWELAETGPEAIDHADLYSCFPAAVQLSAEATGLSNLRPLSVTGGLTFSGGPLNSYVLHATAGMMDRLREEPGSLGLVGSVGGAIAKGAYALYSTRPPEGSLRVADVSKEVARLPRREYREDYSGEATLEAYAPSMEGEEASEAACACLLDDGARHFATAREPEILARMTREELCGRRVRILEGEVVALL